MQNDDKKLNKLLNFAEDSGLAMFDEIQEANDKLGELNETFDGIDFKGVEFLKGEKGDQGEKGDKGDKGDRGLVGKDGKDGKNGLDGIDGLDGLTGPAGPVGPQGLSGTFDPGMYPQKMSAEEMVFQINNLPMEADKQIDASHIKNLLRYMPRYVGSGGTSSGSGTGTGSGNWTPQGITTDGAGGISVGTNLGTSPISIEQTLIDIFYPASGPTVSLATSPTAGIVEAGDAITSVDLTPTTTQGTLPITTLTLSGTDGYAYSYLTPSPTGATEPTQTDGTGFVITTTYTATVGDGTYTGTATKTFTYVFPYYKGVQIAGYPSGSIAVDGGTFTKVVAGNPFTLSLIFTTVAQVPYIVYPASYGKLKKVLDISSFDVSTDWGTQPGGPNTDITPTFNGGAPINVTNSFGSVVSCYVYEFANVTTTTMTYTFSQ